MPYRLKVRTVQRDAATGGPMGLTDEGHNPIYHLIFSAGAKIIKYIHTF